MYQYVDVEVDFDVSVVVNVAVDVDVDADEIVVENVVVSADVGVDDVVEVDALVGVWNRSNKTMYEIYNIQEMV